MTDTTFTTTIQAVRNNTGIEVPQSALDELGSGQRPPVKVTINGYSYQSSVGSMNGKPMISLPKVHREAAGLAGGDPVTVTLELESPDRVVDIPEPLAKALSGAGLMTTFEALAYSKRKEFVRQVIEAKADDTRQRRIAKVLEALNTYGD